MRTRYDGAPVDGLDSHRIKLSLSVRQFWSLLSGPISRHACIRACRSAGCVGGDGLPPLGAAGKGIAHIGSPCHEIPPVTMERSTCLYGFDFGTLHIALAGFCAQEFPVLEAPVPAAPMPMPTPAAPFAGRLSAPAAPLVTVGAPTVPPLAPAGPPVSAARARVGSRTSVIVPKSRAFHLKSPSSAKARWSHANRGRVTNVRPERRFLCCI